jgi:hypothetical protein
MRLLFLAAGTFAAFCSAISAQPTYSREVSRITQAKCAICHRPNDIAPFSLLTFEDASTWAEDIKRVVENRIMPPWKPVPGHGNFKDNYGLTEEERQILLDWVAAGAPEGDEADLPEPKPDTGEWHLGEPDKIVQMTEAFEVPRKKDVYRCFVIPTDLDDDKYVTAVQVLPGNKQIVHHVLLFIDSTGEGEKLDARDEGPGYECYGGPGFIDGGVVGSVATALDLVGGLGGWVPGMRAQPLPEGVALFLPKRAKIVMQVHYYPGGRPGPDQTRVGLYYSKTPVEKRLRYLPILNSSFKIQPGENDRNVTAEFRVPFFAPAKVIQIAPHMHLLGRKIKVEMTSRGETETLIAIDDWDFNWQGFYTYEEPVKVPGNSLVRLTCNFDNSEGNPRNPSNPLKEVGWGEGTEDEMCLAFLGVTLDFENLLPFRLQNH